MAETPEEVLARLHWSPTMEDRAILTRALRAQYVAGLQRAEAAVLAPWDDLGDRPPSPPVALYSACARIRALAEQAKREGA